MLTVRPASAGVTKRTRKAISQRHRQVLRHWYFSQDPRPTQKRAGEWYEEEFDHKLCQATISESLGDSWKFLDTQETTSATTLRHRPGQWDALENRLIEWCRQLEAEEGVAVKGQMILDKAEELWPSIPEYAGETFPELSMGWLTRFKARHGLTKSARRSAAAARPSTDSVVTPLSQLASELWPSFEMPLSTPDARPRSAVAPIPTTPAEEEADVDAEEQMSGVVRSCNDYAHNEIYHMQTTGLFWRQLPGNGGLLTRTTAGKRDRARISIVCCTNSTGNDKLPLWLIGHARQPPALASVNLAAMRVYWRSNKKAWTDGIIMKEWLLSFYQHISGRSIVLLLDQINAYRLGLGVAPPPPNVRIEWLPKRAAQYQPLNQGITQSFKSHYKRQWLRYIIDEMDGNRDPSTTVDILSALRWISRAWNHDVQSATVVAAFQASGIIPCLDSASWLLPEAQDLSILFNNILERQSGPTRTQMTLKQYLNPPNETPPEPEQDIIHRHGASVADEEAEQAEMVVGVALPLSAKEGLRAVRTLHKYLEVQPDVATQDIAYMQDLEKQLEMKAYQYS